MLPGTGVRAREQIRAKNRRELVIRSRCGVATTGMSNLLMPGRPPIVAVPPTDTRARLRACRPLALVAYLSSVAACGPEKADTDTADDPGASSGDASGSTGPTTGDTADASTGEPAPVECACIVDEQQGTPSQPTCGESLCDIVDAETVGIDLDSLVVANPEALDCVLKALRDRTPGIVRWSWTENGGQWTDDGYVLINQDGTGVRRSWGAADVSYIVGEAKFGALPSSATFEQCLGGGGTDYDRFKCATDFDLRAPTLVCDEGWGESLL
jgi:hypothetical protein